MKGRINTAGFIISIASFSLIGLLFPQECHAQIAMRTYVKLSSTGLKPAAGNVNFTAYFKGDGDNVIDTEDTYNNTENEGYYSAAGYCRAYSNVVNPPETVGEGDSYQLWVTNVSTLETATVTGTVGSTRSLSE
jgi:hypothetical protein